MSSTVRNALKVFCATPALQEQVYQSLRTNSFVRSSSGAVIALYDWRSGSEFDRILSSHPDDVYSEEDLNRSFSQGDVTLLCPLASARFARTLEKQRGPSSFSLSSFYNTIRESTQHKSRYASSSLFPSSDVFSHPSSVGSVLIYSEEVTSTQSLLTTELSGLPEGSLFITDTQSSGKGRGDNVWTSPAGCLMFSFKLIENDYRRLPFFQYLVTLALVDSLERIPSCRSALDSVRIKWPNDVYANQKHKIGGVICQSSFAGKGFEVVTGIGLNVLNSTPTVCVQDLLKDSATITREEVLAHFATVFNEMYLKFSEDGFEPFQTHYLEKWMHSGQEVTVAAGSSIQPASSSSSLPSAAADTPSPAPEQISVRILGLAENGYLLAEDQQGKQHELHPDGNRLDFFQGLISRKIMS